MVLDYREKRQVTKNRPKKNPVGLYVFSFVSVGVVAFGLGVVTDRFLLKPKERKTAVVEAAKPASPEGTQAKAPATQLQRPSAQPPATGEPALTFYETLPKGGHGVLGSGLNPKKDEAAKAGKAKGVAPAASPQHTAPQQRDAKPETSPTVALPAEKGSDAKTGVPTGKPEGEQSKEVPAKKGQATKGKFLVQVASSKERKEAESIKTRLVEKGFAAYIVETNVPGKGVWYRVRVGRQMDQSSANAAATMIGKGAIVVPE